MDKKTIIITVSTVLIAGALVGVTIYFVNKNKNGATPPGGLTEQQVKDLVKDLTNTGGVVGNVDESEYSAKNLIPGDKVLKYGAKGRKVAILQALLNHYTGATLKIDGAFGNQTRIALSNADAWKFRKCLLVNPAGDCNVTDIEFLELSNRTKTDKTFAIKYNPKTHAEMKAVYSKYSS